jgi:adenylosuccinate synthase
MSVTCVVGVNWGDEGKGRMVDFLAEDADVVARFQGGNNAGHTVVNEQGEFKLHLIPSGIFNPHVVNVLGPGMVIDLEGLVDELDNLAAAGIDTTNVRLSERATICFPFHRAEDGWEEERLAQRSYGSTKRGIAPAYADRYRKKAIQVGEILHPRRFRERVADVLEWKNLQLAGVYGKAGFTVEETTTWALDRAERLAPLIADTDRIVVDALGRGAHVLFEAQLGALRDVTFGTYPFTSSSGCLSTHALVGPGLTGRAPDRVVGVMKAFSTCVGEGPFPTEMDPDEAAKLRETSFEYGAATGRPRRIGHFDAVASRFGASLQGATEIALTKLDSLSGRAELLICTGYELDGELLDTVPINADLERVTPRYESHPGWDEDVTGVRAFADLPRAARAYVERIEELVGFPISYVSVGPERRALIDRRADVGLAA